jgi:hypothetical protein
MVYKAIVWFLRLLAILILKVAIFLVEGILLYTLKYILGTLDKKLQH